MSTMREIGDDMRAKHDCIEGLYELFEGHPDDNNLKCIVDGGRMIGAGIERILDAISNKYKQFDDINWEREEVILHTKRTDTQRLIVFEVRHNDDANGDSSE